MRPEKVTIVSELQERLQHSPYVFLVDYAGMTVPHFEEARKRLRDAGAKFRVIKNTHLALAAKSFGAEKLGEYLGGQCGIIFGEGDVAAVIKVYKNFVSEFDRPALRAGLVEGQVFDAEQVMKLAELPPKEVLQAQLLGALLMPANQLAQTLNEPANQLARSLNDVPSMLARLLKAKELKETSGETS